MSFVRILVVIVITSLSYSTGLAQDVETSAKGKTSSIEQQLRLVELKLDRHSVRTAGPITGTAFSSLGLATSVALIVLTPTVFDDESDKTRRAATKASALIGAAIIGGLCSYGLARSVKKLKERKKKIREYDARIEKLEDSLGISVP